MGIEFVAPTDALLVEIANAMRPADREEVLALGVYDDVLAALRQSVASSPHCGVFLADGYPLAVLGVAPIDLSCGVGSPWMLGTVALMQHKRRLVAETPRYIRLMQSIYPRLVNHVHAKHVESVRWLRASGFTIHPAAPYGLRGELFHFFEMGA